jgi:hypothetical protein
MRDYSFRLSPFGLAILAYLLFFQSIVAAQQVSPSQNAATDPKVQSPTAALPSTGQTGLREKTAASGSDSPAGSRDDSALLRRRAEWFYRQRASVNGRIPSGAYSRAFQHLQRMRQAEGKIVLHPDGSFVEVASPSPLLSQSTVTSVWNSLGPAPATGGEFSPATGRVMTIAVDPSDTTGNTVLLGGAMGGIWRTTDAGATWTAVGDQNASLAMGSIAFAPSNPSVVYAGTGESSLGFDTYYGVGVLKSSDHGKTWTQTCSFASATCPFIGPFTDALTPGFGFLNFGGAHISYVSVNPTNPNMILAGVQIIVEGPKEGVYCSENGGSTWTNVLPDEEATFVGFASSTVAYAAFGNIIGSSTGAPNGNGIYKATSVGATCATVHFTRLTSGTLPSQPTMGRIDLGIAPSDSTGNTVYASIADASTGSGTNLGVFLTTNGGTTWTKTTAPDVCRQQCWYDNVVKVDPTQPGTAFLAGSAVTDSSGNPAWVVRTINNGTSWSSIIPNLPPGSAGLPHVDNHAIALFRMNTGKVRLYLGNDGGIWRTDDAEASSIQWINLNNPSLSITQFYPTLSLPVSNPGTAFGGTQDNGSLVYQGGVSWQDDKMCGDGGSTAVDFQIPSTIYVGCVTGAPVNVSFQNGAIGTFSQAANGINSSDTSSFVPPLTTDSNTANVLYFGTTKVYQSLDAGTTWAAMSPDLVCCGNWLTALAIAPGSPNVLYAGSNTNQGFTFTNISVTSSNFTGASPWSQGGIPPRPITSVAVDPSDATGMTAYAAFSGFAFVGTDPFGGSVNDPLGHIFKTTTGGQNWIDVSCSKANCSAPAVTDLANVPVNDVLVDPALPNILYAATDLGVFIGDCTVSPCKWSTLGSGLPRVAVLSLRLHESSRTLRAGTHGRGVWDIILNNFTFSGPHISSISPVSANAGGTTFTLTVNGSGLTAGEVQWNGSTTGVTTLAGGSDTQLTATIATTLLTVAAVPQITVKVATQTSNSLPFAILAATPKITSIVPASTPVQTPTPTTNVTIQINGTGFSSSAKVFFNGAQNGITVAAATPSCPLPTCGKATLPANFLGPFGGTNDIVVSNLPPGGGKSNSLTFKVVAPPPPNDNFASAINITQLSFSDTQDSSGATTESSDPVPTCVTQFTNAQGNTGGHPNGVYNTIWYKFTPPVSANLNVDVQGSSYDTVLSVWTASPGSLTQVACNDDINPGIVLQSQLQSVPLAAGTTYYILISSFGPPDPNPLALGGATFLHFYFAGVYPAPTLTSISPISAKSGDPDVALILTGSNFFNGASVQFVDSTTFYGSLLATTFVSPTQLTAVIPASSIPLPGSFLVSVNNPFPNSGSSPSLPFTVNLGVYPVPTLSFIYPSTAISTSLPFTISASGTNFAPGAVLNFNGVPKATTVNSSQNVWASISTADISAPGTVQVTVSNPAPGGGPSAPLPFVIAQPTVVPTITSVSPSSFPALFPTTLTINGTGFVQGAAVTGQGIGYWGTNFVSSTQLTVPNFSASPAGTYQVYLVDPAPAGTSSAFSLTVTPPPSPTIISISPTTGANNGGPITLTVNGTNFLSGAFVYLNGSFLGITGAAFISSTQLSVMFDPSPYAAGVYPVTVVNPYGAGTSNAVDFTVTGTTDFSISTFGSPTATITAGQTATFPNVISLTGSGGFSAQVNLSCSAPATATHCTVSPAAITSGQYASVTVTTTARGLAPPTFRTPPPYWPLPIYFLLVAAIFAAILVALRARRFRLAFAIPVAALALFFVLHSAGCGGGSSSPPPPPPPTGTPAGMYTITVTATSGTLTHTTTLTLVVN